MWGALLLLLTVRTLEVAMASLQEMTVAGVFDEGDTQYADLFRLAVEDVNNNRYEEELNQIVLRIFMNDY